MLRKSVNAGPVRPRNSLAAQSDQFIKFAASKDFDLGEPVERDFGEHGRLTTRTNILFEGTSAFHKRFFDRPVGAEISKRLVSGDVLLFSKLDRGCATRPIASTPSKPSSVEA